MQVAQLLHQVRDEQSPLTSHHALIRGRPPWRFEKMRKLLILLALAVLMTANVGCCSGSFRNWLHRGSPCGTATVAPTMMGAPMILGSQLQAPQVAPTMAPFMAPAPMQQVMVPQPMYCCPQPVPCCPPALPPCPQYQYDPCQAGVMPGWSGSYMEGNMMGECTTFDEGYLAPGSETPVDSDADDTDNADPGPVREN